MIQSPIERATAMKVFGKKWPKKREFITYYLIYKTYGCNKPVNIGHLIDLLVSVLGFNRKVSINMIKHLIRMGFLKREGQLLVTPLCLNVILNDYLDDYIRVRARRKER